MASADGVTSGLAVLCLEHQRAASATADFSTWHEPCKVALVEALLRGLSNSSLARLGHSIDRSLRRDFVEVLPDEIVVKIFSYLDNKEVVACSLVSKSWSRIAHGNGVWHVLYGRRLATDSMWQELMRRRAETMREVLEGRGYHGLCGALASEAQRVKTNWRTGNYRPLVIPCSSNGVYCIQYDDKILVSGSRDNRIRIWDITDFTCRRTMCGHMGSVLCLQYDGRKIVSGSSDGTARVWDMETGQCKAVLTNHAESVLHLRFNDRRLVTCSKDFKVIVWRADGPFGFTLERVLDGHTAAVNVVDFSERYIVSASGDRTIKVWDTESGVLERTIQGHQRGIACLHFRGNRILTGSSDETVRMWNVETGQLIFTLRGHTNLVRCIRFNDHYIVSGSYDNTIIVWDVVTGERISTLRGHESRVFRIQFDHFKIISSSQDDTIRVWDFS